MGHDYTELMSAALDGRLAGHERAEWNTHLATCPRCQARWNALHDIDRMFKNTPLVAPAPGFVARFSNRLARRQAAQQSRQRTLAGTGVLGVGALTVLVTLGWLMAWQLPTLSNLLADAPTYLGNALQAVARWLVLIRAMRETGQALVGFLAPWGPAFAFAYAWLLALLALLWSGLLWRLARPWPPAVWNNMEGVR